MFCDEYAGAQESKRFGTVSLGLGRVHHSLRSIEMALPSNVSGLLRDKKVRLGSAWDADRFCGKLATVDQVSQDKSSLKSSQVRSGQSNWANQAKSTKPSQARPSQAKSTHILRKVSPAGLPTLCKQL